MSNPSSTSQSYPLTEMHATLPLPQFLERVTDLRNNLSAISRNIANIEFRHRQDLSVSDSTTQSQLLDRLATETSALNRTIRDELRTLSIDAHQTTSTRDRSAKDLHVAAVKHEFESLLRNYRAQEASFQASYRDQIARQYRIVNPAATEAELRDAISADWSDEGVFQSALRSNRTDQAFAALGHARARHNELLTVEKTLAELADMMQTLATLVREQEAPVQAAVDNAYDTLDHTEKGQKELKRAIVSAHNIRKWKWWILLVVVLLLGLIAGLIAWKVKEATG